MLASIVAPLVEGVIDAAKEFHQNHLLKKKPTLVQEITPVAQKMERQSEEEVVDDRGYESDASIDDHAESFMEYAVRNMSEVQRNEFFQREAQRDFLKLEAEKYDDQKRDALLAMEAISSLMDYKEDWSDEEFKRAHKKEYLRLVEQKLFTEKDPGFIGHSLKSGAKYIRGQLQKIDPDNMQQLERVSKLLNYYYYASNIMSGARAGAMIGAAAPVPGGAEVGAMLGAAYGGAKAYTVDQVTEAGITLSANALKASYSNLTEDDAYLLVGATVLAHGSKDLLRNLAIKVQSGSSNFAKSIKEVVASEGDLAYVGVGDTKVGLKAVPKEAENLNLARKAYPDTVEKINNRYPSNGDLAGQKYPLNKLPEHIQQKYPDSVIVDERGFIRFEPYTHIDEVGRVYKVELDSLSGDNKLDFKKANKAMGVEGTPDGCTWHHVEDTKTLIAIPSDLHDAIRHTGGRAVQKAKDRYDK